MKSEKELSRLNRNDLLEIMLAITEENEKLKEQVKELQAQLDDRAIKISESGTLAEAVVKLNGLFEAAQATCDEYVYNVQKKCRKTENACERYIYNVQMRCDELIEETERKCTQMIAEAEQKVKG